VQHLIITVKDTGLTENQLNILLAGIILKTGPV